MRKTCAKCGKPYEAQRSASKYCSTTCRAGATKLRQRGLAQTNKAPVVPIHNGQDKEPEIPAAPKKTPLTDATRKELEKAELIGDPLGTAALALAIRIDQGYETGSAMAAMVKEYRAVYSEAMVDAKQEPDTLDELRARRDRKLG